MKMKFMMLSMLAIAALTGCSKDDATNVGGNGDTPLGDATYATFSFKVGGPVSTYASMPSENTDAQEKTVNGAVMLIFDATNGKLGKLVTKEEIDTGAKHTVKTTSGSKRIYVMTNVKEKTALQTKLATLIVGTSTLADLYALATDGAFVAGGADTDMGEGFKELIVADKMVMSNVADATAVYNLHPGISADDSQNATGANPEEKNNFKFNVLRSVAKASLKVALKENDDKTTDKIFTLKKDVAFAIRNINRSVFFIQQYASDLLTSTVNDHTLDNAIRPWSPFYDKFDTMTDAQLKDISSYAPYFFSGYDFDVTTTIEGAASKPVYFSPNSMNKALRGNTTYYGIRTQVQKIEKDEIAASITLDGSTNYIKTTAANTDYDNTAGTEDFYFLRELPADMLRFFATGDKIRKVFVDADIAFQAMALIIKFSPSVTLPESSHFVTGGNWTGADLKEAYSGTGTNPLSAKDKELIDRYIGLYSDGYSYYRLNIYETTTTQNKRHLVRRNHSYASTVTSFNTLGTPTPGDLDKDPEIPVDADVTNVTAVITVLDWCDVTIEEDL